MADVRLRVLLVEDNPGDARLMQELVRTMEGTPFQLECADRLTTGLARLAEDTFDVVLLDLTLPESRGLDTFMRLHTQVPAIPIVVLTGLDDETLAVTAVQQGAQDYLVKGRVDSSILARSLRYAIERTRLHRAEASLRATEEEFRIARQIQQKLFPATAPVLPGVDISGASYPAVATGGDYFDYFPLADGALGIAIGDVSGHGFGPALLMAETRAYLRAYARTQTDVGEILQLVNRALVDDTGEDRFVTLLLASLEARARTLVYSSAGHTSGYILDAVGSMKVELASTSVPLGLFVDRSFPTSRVLTLQAGDTILLLTDGIKEAISPDLKSFGVERALDVLRAHRQDSAQQTVEALYEAVRTFCQNKTPADDITMIVVKTA